MKIKKQTSRATKQTRLFDKRTSFNVVAFGATALAFGILGVWLTSYGDAAVKLASFKPVPATTVLKEVSLQDATVMQSFAFDQKNRAWYFAQVMQGGRVAGMNYAANDAAGNLTITKVSTTGKKLGYMYLKGFGHGVSFGVEPVGTKVFLWTEALPGDGPTGTKIARFEWKNGATVAASSDVVTLFGVNGGNTSQTPFVDAPANLIGVRYWSDTANGMRFAVYPLDRFKARDYTPIARTTQPSNQYRSGNVGQGWALNGTKSVYALSGEAYSTDNPPPGNAMIYETDTASGQQINEARITALSSVNHREPEGVSVINGNVCVGFASGDGGARKANVVCQRAV